MTEKLVYMIYATVWCNANATMTAYIYTTLNDFSTKYLVMCKVYIDVGGIK